MPCSQAIKKNLFIEYWLKCKGKGHCKSQEMFICKKSNVHLQAAKHILGFMRPLPTIQCTFEAEAIGCPFAANSYTVSPRLPNKLARCQFGNCAKGDVVLVASPHGLQPWTATHVWVHFAMGTTSCCIAAAWEFLDYDHTTHVASWKKSEQIFPCNHVDILAPVTYTVSKEVAKTMVPYNLRQWPPESKHAQ